VQKEKPPQKKKPHNKTALTDRQGARVLKKKPFVLRLRQRAFFSALFARPCACLF
jgi:hypothetical protein